MNAIVQNSTADIKLELFRYIDKLNEKKLRSFYNFFVRNNFSSQTDFWDKLTEWEQADILAGINDLNEGKYKDVHKVLAKYQ